jgi:hypothetical protein
MLKLAKFVLLLASLSQLVHATYYSNTYSAGSTSCYNAGTAVTYQPYTYVGFPAGARVTYTQPCTVYYQQATTAYSYNGPISYPANTHVNYASGTQMTYAPGSGVYASGATPTVIRYDQFNGNNYGIAQYPSQTSVQFSGTQAGYFAPGTASTNYYNPGMICTQ